MLTLIVSDRLAFDEAYRNFLQSVLGSPYISELPASSTAVDGRTVFYRVPDAVLPVLRDHGIEFEIAPA
jgi:hypothetical protein